MSSDELTMTTTERPESPVQAAEQVVDNVKESVSGAVESTAEAASELARNAQEAAGDAQEATENAASDLKENAQEVAGDAQEATENAASDLEENAQEAAGDAQEATENAASDLKENAQEVAEEAEETVTIDCDEELFADDEYKDLLGTLDDHMSTLRQNFENKLKEKKAQKGSKRHSCCDKADRYNELKQITSDIMERIEAARVSAEKLLAATGAAAEK